MLLLGSDYPPSLSPSFYSILYSSPNVSSFHAKVSSCYPRPAFAFAASPLFVHDICTPNRCISTASSLHTDSSAVSICTRSRDPVLPLLFQALVTWTVTQSNTTTFRRIAPTCLPTKMSLASILLHRRLSTQRWLPTVLPKTAQMRFELEIGHKEQCLERTYYMNKVTSQSLTSNAVARYGEVTPPRTNSSGSVDSVSHSHKLFQNRAASVTGSRNKLNDPSQLRLQLPDASERTPSKLQPILSQQLKIPNAEFSSRKIELRPPSVESTKWRRLNSSNAVPTTRLCTISSSRTKSCA